jgi:ABC-type branched-subunit amino acid transport system substrate-binding protein
LAVLALSVPAAFAASAGAASSSAKKACNGPEIKVMNITNLTATIQTTVPELPQAVRAAAKNITDTCQLGGKVTVLSCDDKFNANDASACARQAVAEKVIALVGTYGSWGEAMLPIVAAAGIPSVGNNTNGPQESSNPLSFGTFQPPVTFAGYFTVAAGTGVGISVVDTVPIPVTATDMAQFAARVVTSSADAVMFVLGPGQIAPIVRSMVQQGVDLKNKVRIFAGLNTITPTFIEQLGQDAVGIVSPGTAWTPDDKKNPAMKRFLKELKKAGEPSKSSETTTIAVNGWGAMHMIADVLEDQTTKDAATLVKALNTAGPLDMNKYGMPNLDFAKNSFPEHPELSKLRIFVDTISVNQVGQDLKMHALTKKFVSAKEVQKIKLLKF